MRVTIPVRYEDEIEVRVDSDEDLTVSIMESDGSTTSVYLLRNQVEALIAALQVNVESVRESAEEL